MSLIDLIAEAMRCGHDVEIILRERPKGAKPRITIPADWFDRAPAENRREFPELQPATLVVAKT